MRCQEKGKRKRGKHTEKTLAQVLKLKNTSSVNNQHYVHNFRASCRGIYAFCCNSWTVCIAVQRRTSILVPKVCKQAWYNTEILWEAATRHPISGRQAVRKSGLHLQHITKPITVILKAHPLISRHETLINYRKRRGQNRRLRRTTSIQLCSYSQPCHHLTCRLHLLRRPWLS